MATWWVTEALPIPATALLPLIVLPLFGVADIQQVATPYMHPIVVLLMGGFIFARTIEHWHLHERIALTIVSKSVSSPSGLIGGFMLASAFLSMWLSNAATAIMMMPIALSVIAEVTKQDSEQQRRFVCALLLGIAFACSIGGLGTPVGTPINLIVMGYLADNHSIEISFFEWMLMGSSLIVVLLPLTWFAMNRWIFKISADSLANSKTGVAEKLDALGKLSIPEKRVMMLFVLIASLWIFRRPLNELEVFGITLLSGLTDHTIAIIAALLCFILPAGTPAKKSQRLLSWEAAEGIPFGVLILFGGSMSLAYSITHTGLSSYIGHSLATLGHLPLFVMIIVTACLVLALAEVTNNVATTSVATPIIGAVALELGLPAEMLVIPVAFAAGCAFMLPMATGPNAVAFATGKIPLSQMAWAGMLTNLLALALIAPFAYFVVPYVVG
jgi:sodium-dependent dicarboxylate transporter 2/3/5